MGAKRQQDWTQLRTFCPEQETHFIRRDKGTGRFQAGSQAPGSGTCMDKILPHITKGHRRRSSCGKKVWLALLRWGDMQEQMPFTVALKVGAFLGLEPWLGGSGLRW